MFLPFLSRSGLTRVRSSWCQCLECQCLQENLCWGFVSKKELVMQRLWKVQSLSSRWLTIFIHFPYSKLEPREVQCHKCQERITSAWHNRSQAGSNGSCWKVWRRFLPTSFQEYVKDCVAGWKADSWACSKGLSTRDVGSLQLSSFRCQPC